jgi:hypothetical protein
VPQRGIVSTNRGHHWIIEDCVIHYSNGVGLDIGNQTWNSDEPAKIGFHIIRRNHILDAGVCGLAGYQSESSLIEYNVIENVGWQATEAAWESAGVKLHRTKDCVFRNNVIRNVVHASGLWLDYDISNTRVMNNVIGDIQKTNRAAIYLEASHDPNMIDHNVIWDVTSGDSGNLAKIYHNGTQGGWGILVDGSDESIIAHNLIGFCQNSAIKSREIENRIVTGRGGTGRWNRVINNMFYRCPRGVDFGIKENFAEGNLYLREGYDQGEILNRIYKPQQL